MIKPLGNRIFVKKDGQPEKKGNIILLKSEGAYAPPYSGIITGVGKDIEDKDYKIGERVLFHDTAGSEITIQGENIFFIRESDVTAIIEKNVQIF